MPSFPSPRCVPNGFFPRWFRRFGLAVAATLALAVGLPPTARAETITLVTPPDAAAAERRAAQELQRLLAALYPNYTYTTAAARPATGAVILVGAATHASVRGALRAAEIPTAPESYVVRTRTDGACRLAIVAGADARGTAFAVSALLEKLGVNFHLSGEALPPPRPAAPDFSHWELQSRPLVAERLVFNWHNFLSGCSTWNLPDWQRWTAQAQKMGYNGIMVHAYGNNPMAGYTFDGVDKPTGYLSTTVRGRDWSTMHVTDVRRLHGGEAFARAAFGAEAGLAPEAARVPAAQALMRAVFADAADRAMEVYFAVDVDTPSANSPEHVTRLPESARFRIKGTTNPTSSITPDQLWLPNPDTPEGYTYFRAQVAGWLRTYPQITRLVAWFRRGSTPWMELKVEELPAAWQKEWAEVVAADPAVAKFWRGPGLFAVGKIVRAYARALEERGGARTPRLCAGTWGFEFLPAADRFFPPGVPLLGLDYDILHEKPQLGTAESRAPLRAIGAHRPLIPIVWAHHDDGHYVGRPYTPPSEFAAKLADAQASGFGIIHWTTRPLDLFFSSLARQVWSHTQNEPLADTCHALAGPWFGEANRERGGAYLAAWMEQAPRFGRETSDWFIDRKLTDLPAIIAACRARQAMLAAATRTGLTDAQSARLDYYRELEEFIARFHAAHGKFQESQERLQRGDRAGAIAALAELDPAAVITGFARGSAYGGRTRGEEGLIVSLNTRWLSHIVRHRQALGLEPVRIRFAPTSHDLLAQSRGTFTFHFGPERALWECWGAAETGAEIVTLPAAPPGLGLGTAIDDETLWHTGVRLQHPLTLALRPIMAVDNRKRVSPLPLPAGSYRLRLFFQAPATSTLSSPTELDLALRVLPAPRPPAQAKAATITKAAPKPPPAADLPFTALERFAPTHHDGAPQRLIERTYPVAIAAPAGGSIEVRFTPRQGAVVLSAIVLEPVPLADPEKPRHP